MLRPTSGALIFRHCTRTQVASPQSRIFQHSSIQNLLLQRRSRSIPTLSLSATRHFSGSVCRRQIETAAPASSAESKNASSSGTPEVEEVYQIYHGPLDSTFRRLKLFSLASFSLSFTLAPFIFLVESNLPFSARLALASIAVGTSGLSTAVIGWCGKPYVTTLKRIPAELNGGAEGLEMTTLTLGLKPKITTVYDPYFLIETGRPFAKWELAQTMVLSPDDVLSGSRTISPGQEETVAETKDKNGDVVGRWVVKWGENGEGTCREVGNVIRYFNVHEELLK